MANLTEPLQLINKDMALDEAGLQSFAQTVRDGDGGARYVVVSILGAQSSGKSTLLNCLFETKFAMMDATKDWVQTTKGISVAMSKEVLIMDVEGSDSGERQGQIKCERKFAAFCFAMSQVVLVNMKNDSIGRDSGGCTSLLEAALEFMICFLGHHKITLIIVVRDKHPDTPVDIIKKKVIRSIDQIWTKIRKPEGLQDKEFDNFLDVKVVVMHNCVHEKDKFVKEVSELLDVIVSSQGRKKYSALGFSRKVQEQWPIINNHQELNIQTYKELIDHKRSDKVTLKCIGSFEQELGEILKRQPTEFSGREVEGSLHRSLEMYHEATKIFTASVTLEGQEILKSELLKKWKIAFDKRITELHPKILESFGNVLKERLNSDTDSAAQKHVEDCITQSLKDYQERCRGMMPEHVQWDTTDVDSLLKGQLEANAAEIFNSVMRKVALSLAKNTCATVAIGGAILVDVAIAGGAATIATAAATGTEATVAGGAAALASGVAAAGSKSTVGTIKKMYDNVKFLVKNANYDPKKPSKSDDLEKS